MTSARFFNSNYIPYYLHSIETHILTPSPYYRGQYLTLDNRVVEIDKEYVKEISGNSHTAHTGRMKINMGQVIQGQSFMINDQYSQYLFCHQTLYLS
jgi:hypothetical protein